MKGKQWLSIALGIVTSTGGFLDVAAIATSGEAGAKFGLGLIWAILLATVGIMLLLEMVGRFTSISKKTYAEAIREEFGFKFFVIPLLTEIITDTILLPAELGGVAIGLSLVTGISWHILFPIVVLVVWLIIWLAPFNIIENGPAIFGLVVLALPVGIIVLGGPKAADLKTLVLPQIKEGDLSSYLFLVAAILGAVTSPYLIHFYSSGAREERWGENSLIVNRVTAIAGMSFGSLGAISLIVLAGMVLQPLQMQATTLGEVGLTLALPFGQVGGWLFAAILIATCLGASLEIVLTLGYVVSQGLGWEWGQDKTPAQAARFNIVMLIVLLVALGIGLLGLDPLQIALLASTITALFLPISLGSFLIIMNNREYLQDKVNSLKSNVALIIIIIIAFLVAVVSLPLQILSGGG